ncbi:YcxB family protein [Streptomyces sp. NPDC002676]
MVELVYQPTRQDMRQALAARAKASTAARRMQRLALISVAALVGASVVPLAKGDGVDMGSLVPGVFVVAMLFVLRPVLMARQFHKLAARHGEYRAVAGDDGVTVTNTGGSSHLNWTAAPRYAETPDLFVLLSGDKDASCLTVLPKRGIREPGGVDALRALLDGHITRL